jgi:prepilin-type N-terminal cleavage/methylation domain-containing protein
MRSLLGMKRGRARRECRNRSRGGFTLTELLITLTLSGIVVGSMVSFFVIQTRSSRLAGVRVEAVQRSRFAAEMLRREMGLAGAGIPVAQPLVVFAGPNDFVFSADLSSSTPGDRIAVYQTPAAPLVETEGADSGSVILPNSESYPLTWYGPSRTPGRAETIRYSFVSRADGSYALIRAVNAQPADTLLRGLKDISGRDFFSYNTIQDDGVMREVSSDPIWHDAAVHESAADTSGSALTDRIKLVEINFTVMVRGRRGEQDVERLFSMAVALNNAGLIRNAACGDPPKLGVVPAAEVTGVDPLAVTVTWAPATDEVSGEKDVHQYTLYRRELSEVTPKPIASIPPNPDLPNYTYVDNDVEPGATYVYLLGATDCTPTQSPLAVSASVTVPNT